MVKERTLFLKTAEIPVKTFGLSADKNTLRAELLVTIFGVHALSLKTVTIRGRSGK